MFSKACEYGIKASICIAQKQSNNQRVGLREIAKTIDSPVAFTAKILQILTRAGYLISTKGPSGGFVLAYPARDISLAEIVAAIDGDAIFTHAAWDWRTVIARSPALFTTSLPKYAMS
ncbi:MAG: Rrf2 family transcriptional regulator [Owenweeksia sp.]|nr:Rrf2 family transcriptional regulator [Owenweeksia sp.]